MQGKKISKPITRIAIISITLSIVVNLVTLMVVKGFQTEVKQKINGFSSQIFIVRGQEKNIQEAEPFLKNEHLISEIKKNKEIIKIQGVAYKPILLQNEIETENGSQNQINGSVLKGVGKDFDFSFFKEHLITGKIPRVNDKEIFNEILISKRVQEDLQLKLNDTLRAFFVQNKPVLRFFKIAGIYETGLEEFDKKTVIGDIRIIQELNQWGSKARIRITDTLKNDQLIIYANAKENNKELSYNWGEGFERFSGFPLKPTKDTTIRLIIKETLDNSQTFLDTAYLKIKIKGASNYSFRLNDDKTLQKEYLSNDENCYQIKTSNGFISITSTDGKGNGDRFIGGYEVNVQDWNSLPKTVKSLTNLIELSPEFSEEKLTVSSIIDQQMDLFLWLNFLDVNVLIIIVLMVLIGIINMSSSLLVMILVRSNFIGILKSIGANNWTIRKIFLYNAFYLILRGVIYGNLLVAIIYFAQAKFGLLKLNPEVYYLNKVPFHFDLLTWIILNVGTILVCLIALLLPSYLITKISPAKAVKFN